MPKEGVTDWQEEYEWTRRIDYTTRGAECNRSQWTALPSVSERGDVQIFGFCLPVVCYAMRRDRCAISRGEAMSAKEYFEIS